MCVYSFMNKAALLTRIYAKEVSVHCPWSGVKYVDPRLPFAQKPDLSKKLKRPRTLPSGTLYLASAIHSNVLHACSAYAARELTRLMNRQHCVVVDQPRSGGRNRRVAGAATGS